MNETKTKAVGTRGDIQWDKLSPAQREIVKEVQEKHRKQLEETMKKEAIKHSRIISLQKSLQRGDITLQKFEIKMKELGCSPEIINIKLRARTSISTWTRRGYKK